MLIHTGINEYLKKLRISATNVFKGK